MPDWKTLDTEIDAIVEKAAKATDKKLASKMSSVMRLTDDEIIELFPDPADVKKLKDLIIAVKSAEDRNTKINNIIANIDDFSGIIVTLLGKFV